MTIAAGAALIAMPLVYLGWTTAKAFGAKEALAMLASSLLMTACVAAGAFLISL